MREGAEAWKQVWTGHGWTTNSRSSSHASDKKVVDSGWAKENSGTGEKKKERKKATVTENKHTKTREQGVEERAAERHAFNGSAGRRSLFTVAHLCGLKKNLQEGQRGAKRQDRWSDRGAQSGGKGVRKLGPLHSSTTESLERDNGLEGVIKRGREEAEERKRAGKWW